MTIDLQEVKTYCRIDGSEEDTILGDLIEAAKGYLDNAGVPEPTGRDPLYALAVKALVLNYYDHRGLEEQSGMAEIAGMQNIITQLKLNAVANRKGEGS